MQIGLILSVIFGLFPMLTYAIFVYWLDRFEKEPLVLAGAAFSWGAVVAAGIAFSINSYIGSDVQRITGSSSVSRLTTGSLVAPVVEESLKGIAVLIVMLVFSRHFDSMMDGIVYAGITALGFAATENIYYIYNYGYLVSGLKGLLYLVFVRDIVVGWQHPFFTAFTGIGISISRLTQQITIRIVAPLLGWTSAVLIHSLHNTLSSLMTGSFWSFVGTLVDWVGWGLMAGFILWNIRQEQAWVKEELRGELSSGLLTPGQFWAASSSAHRTQSSADAFLAGNYRATSRFLQLCGRLAHKKHLARLFGEDERLARQIQELRGEISSMGAAVSIPGGSTELAG